MRFRPRLVPTLATLVVVAVTVRLAVWQLDRHHQQSERAAYLASRSEAPALGNEELVRGGDLAHRRARLTGRWADAAPALVTGGLVAEQPGYRMFVPLVLHGGQPVLVDRGWVPADLTGPELRALQAEGPVTVEGLLVPLEGEGAAAPPRVTEDGRVLWSLRRDLAFGFLPRALGPPLADMAAAVEAQALGYALFVGPEMETETRRIPGPPPIGGYALPVSQTHHLSYTAQWLAIGALTLALWAWHTVRQA